MKPNPDLAWFRSLVYGPTSVCLWWAIYPDGRMHLAAEFVALKSLISTFSQVIQKQTRQLEITAVRYTVADRVQMSGKSKETDGETRLDTFRANGIRIRETSHDPIQGWTRIAELFAIRKDGRPWLTIDPSCEEVKRAITNAVSDPTDLESVLTPQPALIALRIGAMSRPAPRPFALPPLPKNAVGHLLNECRNPPTRRTLAWR